MAEIALAEKKTSDAIHEFRRGDLAPDGPVSSCTLCLPLSLGRAFDAANQPDSAIAAYETFIAMPFPFSYFSWSPIAFGAIPVVHERLGQLYEARGNTEKAAEHNRAFIELWKNADAELQPRVAQARRGLAKLTPVEKPRR